jgi:hypothetical protein
MRVAARNLIVLLLLWAVPAAAQEFKESGAVVFNAGTGGSVQQTIGGHGSVTVHVTSLSGTGTVTFEVSNSPATGDFGAVDCVTPADRTTIVNDTSSAGRFECSVAGWKFFRARYARTSGAATIIVGAAATGGGSGGGGGGTTFDGVPKDASGGDAMTTPGLDAARVDIRGVGGTAPGASNPLSTRLSDGTNFLTIAGACTPVSVLLAASVNETQVTASAGYIDWASVFSIDSVPVFVHWYDDDAADVDETDTPKITIGVPANSTAANGAGSNPASFPAGAAFANGITYRAVKGIPTNSTTALEASEVILNYCWRAS